MMAQPNIDELRQAGEKYFNEGQFRQALETFDQALGIAPDDIQTLRSKAVLSAALGDNEAALQCYERMIALIPTEAWPHVLKGDASAWLGRFDEALACYDRALSMEPNDAAIWCKKGLALKSLDRWEDALAVYDKALAINPRESQALAGKGDVLSVQKKYREAMEMYLEAEKVSRSGFQLGQMSHPGSVFGAPDWVIRADRLNELGDVAEAIVYYDRAIASDPKNLWGWKGKGLALRSQRKLDDALKCFDEALRIDPGHAVTWLDRGGILMEQANYSAAALSYNKALKLEPKSYIALANKGVICQKQGKYDMAIKWYDKAIEADPTLAFPWENKGACLDQLQRLDEAIECYDRAIELQPKSFWSWNNKGWAYVRQDKSEEALRFFDQAIELDGSESLPWVNKSETLKKLGRIDEAIQTLNSARGVVSNQNDILLNLATLLADYRSDDGGALECYERILESSPDDTLVKAGLVEILIKLGRYRDGRQRALEVVQASKDHDLRYIVDYLVVVSHALEGSNINAELPKLVERFRSPDKTVLTESTNWNYRGITRTIRKSDLAVETKFLLLTLIDLQRGKIDSSELAFFESEAAEVSTAEVSNVQHPVSRF
jgi:tetratricopeptide (TPR) repeat protein